MLKFSCSILLLLFVTLRVALGQVGVADSLKKLLAESRQDTMQVLLLIGLANNYQFSKSDSAIILVNKAIEQARRLHFEEGEIRALARLGEIMRVRGEFAQALEAHFRALRLSRQSHNLKEEANTLSYAAVVYNELGEYREALNYLFQSEKIYESISQLLSGFGFSNIGNAYEKLNMLDSALYFQRQALASPTLNINVKPLSLIRLGVIEYSSGNTTQALQYYHEALHTTFISGDLLNRAGKKSFIKPV